MRSCCGVWSFGIGEFGRVVGPRIWDDVGFQASGSGVRSSESVQFDVEFEPEE